jgi:uncharacterized membrane protein YgcG
MLEESPENSSVLAHVNSVPATLDSERPSRDVVTLYGEPTVQSLALALAAVVRSQRAQERAPGIVRHLGIWADRGAVGDAAWRDAATGRLVSRDLTISIEQLQSTAAEFLSASGADLRLLVAGLQMPDWPEGTRRAISFSLSEPALAGVGADGGGGGSGGDAGDDGGGGGGGGGGGPDLLETYRSSAGLTYDNEGD